MGSCRRERTGTSGATAVATFVAATIAAVMAVIPVAPRAAEAVNEITLEEAIDRALVSQPAMIQADADRANARAAKRVAWGGYLPQVSTSGSAAKSNQGRIDSSTGRPVPPEVNYTLGWNASLELFDGFRRLGENDAAAADLRAADASYRDQRFQVTLATKQSFYNAAAREELVRVAESQLARADQQFQVSVGKLRAGSATRSDSLRATVEVGNARIALLEARAGLATAQAQLGRQVGSDEPVRAVPDSIVAAPPDTSELRADALESAPDLLAAEARSDAADAQVKAARAEFWPSLGLSYSNNYQGVGEPFSHFDDYDDTRLWRFGLSWPIFNGFQREARQIQATRGRSVAEAQALDARRQLNADLTQQLFALATSYEAIAIAETNVAAASEDFRVQNERYRLGASTIVDLTTSQANLTEAQVDLVQARFNYLIARAQVEALAGREL